MVVCQYYTYITQPFALAKCVCDGKTGLDFLCGTVSIQINGYYQNMVHKTLDRNKLKCVFKFNL